MTRSEADIKIQQLNIRIAELNDYKNNILAEKQRLNYYYLDAPAGYIDVLLFNKEMNKLDKEYRKADKEMNKLDAEVSKLQQKIAYKIIK